MELVLNTFGVSLNLENEAFIVTQKGQSQRIPYQGISSIQICQGASITSDAILFAIEKEIEIIFLARSGDPKGRVWSSQYGSISTIRKGQLDFCNSKEAVLWIKGVIRQKIENQQALILMMNIYSSIEQQQVSKAVAKLEEYRDKIESLDGELVIDVAASLRGWEGMSSKIYFETLNLFVPEEMRFKNRTQHPATDPLNAFLNYGYGILYGKVEGALIKAGIDPYIGVLHRDNYNRPVLVYDVIEIYRIWVDYVVYSFAIQHEITDDYYSVKEDGSHWLESLGRRVLIQSLNDYLDEVIEIKGVSRSRLHHILLYAQNLAQIFKNQS